MGLPHIMIGILSIFAVIFVVPFTEEWPYRTSFTLEHFQTVFEDSSLYGVYTNSLMVAIVTALVGTLMAYGAALVTARSSVSQKLKGTIDSIALVTNTIPGMVIGLCIFILLFRYLPSKYICNPHHL